MEFTDALHAHKGQVITHQLLMSLLSGYKRPHDKVHELQKKGVLTSVKRGIYIAGPLLEGQGPALFLLANHIMGPSYVSLDAALSYHGLIPEQVFEISSATTKPTRQFSTPAGLFSYTYLPLPYYAFGIIHADLGNNQHALIASAEKALFDKIICTAGIVLRSTVDAYEYLVENLRMDEEQLKNLDLDMMNGWIKDAKKKESLLMVLKMIKNL